MKKILSICILVSLLALFGCEKNESVIEEQQSAELYEINDVLLNQNNIKDVVKVFERYDIDNNTAKLYYGNRKGKDWFAIFNNLGIYCINNENIDKAKNSIPFNAISSLSFLYAISNIKIENNKNIKLAIFIYCVNTVASVSTAYMLKNIKYIVIIDAYTKLFNTFPVTKSFIFFTILFFSFESFSNFLSSFLFVYMLFYHFF